MSERDVKYRRGGVRRRARAKNLSNAQRERETYR